MSSTSCSMVGECMDEGGEQKESRDKRKPSEKLKPVRPWTALIFWVLLNLIWIAALPMPAQHPVMEPNTGFREWHDMEVPEVIGRELPLHIECSFEPKTEADKSVRVVWSLRTDTVDDPIEVRTWDANLGDDCATSEHSVPGGDYVLHVELFYANGTKIDRSNVAEVSDISFHMQYWIYQPVSKEGFVAANLLGFTILVFDQSIRHRRRRRKLDKMTNLPLHKLRQKEEWEQLVDSMEGGDEADVERFVMPTANTAEAERERMRKQFAAQEEAQMEAATEGESDISEKEIMDLVGEFEGTEKGLKGDLEADEDIHTVRDIWKRIEEDET